MDDLLLLSEKLIKLLNRPYSRSFLKSNPFGSRMTILLGHRGVGKTTSIIQYLMEQKKDFLSLNHILYLPVDHFQIGRRSLYEIAEQFHELGGKIICFDEIHRYTNWSQELKSIYDTFPSLKIIASGSSALEIYKGTHDLSRRAITRYMYGYSFREYLEMKSRSSFRVLLLSDILEDHLNLSQAIIQQLEDLKLLKILVLFKEYLKLGYYPYFSECSSEEDFFFSVDKSIHTTIEVDIQSIYPTLSGSSIKKILNLLSIIAEQVPFKPNFSKLTQLLDLQDQRTLKTYLKYLEDAGLIHALLKEGKRLSVLEKPEKIFLSNTNMVYALGRINSNVGNIRETFFVSTLKVLGKIAYSKQGDFVVNKNVFEIGGRSKSFNQIKNVQNSYLALDDIEYGINNKIPLWLFGFLY